MIIIGREKRPSNETWSSVAAKIQRTESNVTAQSSAISNPLPVNQDQIEEKCSAVYPLIWSEQQYEKFKQKKQKQLDVR